MLSPISNNAVSSAQVEAAPASKPAVSTGATQQASLRPDTASISSQGHAAAAGDVDHDGDSH